MTNKILTAWAWLMAQFERGDLVPLIILVSAVHYTAILAGHDVPAVAVAIGLLVDLGHYRWVRAAVRYKLPTTKRKTQVKAGRRELFVRWALAAGMTALAVLYQQRYYADWALSLPLPALVLSLAWLAEKDKTQGERKAAQPAAIVAPAPAPQIAQAAQPAQLLPASPAPAALPHCTACGLEFTGAHPAQQASAHHRYCPARRTNGHKPARKVEKASA